ncbi:HNH endonuclease [Mesobacillus jeotgali]|uniref:HNH endonuclease n=1 Tax=Mesobacillus jeotgali TaxID=129985 RepID=UPI000C83E95B|nr:HNH endonuclease [Mesobacillus jeotgali]
MTHIMISKKERLLDREEYLRTFDLDNPDFDYDDYQNIGTKFWDYESGWSSKDNEEEYPHFGLQERFVHKVSDNATTFSNQVKDSSILDSVRDRNISNELKARYSHRCQVCDRETKVNPEQYLVHTHHLHSFADNGPDEKDNMIVVCVICHTYLDYGSMYIEPDTYIIHHFETDNKLNGKKLRVKHYINREHLLYQKRKYIG